MWQQLLLRRKKICGRCRVWNYYNLRRICQKTGLRKIHTYYYDVISAKQFLLFRYYWLYRIRLYRIRRLVCFITLNLSREKKIRDVLWILRDVSKTLSIFRYLLIKNFTSKLYTCNLVRYTPSDIVKALHCKWEIINYSQLSFYAVEIAWESVGWKNQPVYLFTWLTMSLKRIKVTEQRVKIIIESLLIIQSS